MRHLVPAARCLWNCPERNRLISALLTVIGVAAIMLASSATASPTLPTATYSYDPTAAGATTSYTYDPAAELKTTTLPNGYVETRTYDHAGQLSSLTNARAGLTLSSSAYSYDPAGNPLTLTSQDGVTAFGYDTLDRLTAACYQSSCTGATDYIRYSYDNVGNPPAKPGPPAPPATPTTRSTSSPRATARPEQPATATTLSLPRSGSRVQANRGNPIGPSLRHELTSNGTRSRVRGSAATWIGANDLVTPMV
jgi:YD repeat-containing protein